MVACLEYIVSSEILLLEQQASNDQNVPQVISVLCPGAGFCMLHQKCTSTLTKVLSMGSAVSLNHLWE